MASTKEDEATTTQEGAGSDPEAIIVTSTVASQTCPIESLKPETFYSKIRPLAIFIKIFGTFPLTNVMQRDGRLLVHKWTNLWQLYDLVLCVAVMLVFFYANAYLVGQITNPDDKYKLMVWLGATFYLSAARAMITFLVSHFYAHKYPELFQAIEEYHFGIGANIIRGRTKATFQKVGPIVASLFMLLFLEVTSFMFFSQFTEIDSKAWPAGVSFMFMYMWKELPMNMFICILMHLISRFDEIREKVREVRLKDEKDASCDLESHRLQYAALMNIINLLQKCYGLQLAVNMFFLIVESIAELFIFIVISEGKNVYLMDLTVYNFCAAGLFIFFLDRIERKSEHVLEELSSINLNSKSRLQQMQVQLFVSQIQARPLQISASGFCVINNSLIGSLFGVIATYLIVLLQFAPHVMNTTNTTSSDTTEVSGNSHVYVIQN
ncbi:uncharacterized protein LOC132198375 [Neocloeon triangulifer]|uniref:uncharacterized protein LOC132198375 n=1 Tax=Neocloeon triangulifer TaxID=2078957 RepID=UPI00286F7D04|nr:uncharacterized protein LOC132198375 [Neocloeon triangulifer]